MCLASIAYHVRGNGVMSDHYPVCNSELVSDDYNRKYLAGAGNLTWDKEKLEFVAGEPENLKGMTVSEISDSRFVRWTEGLRADLQRDHIVGGQMGRCPGVGNEMARRLRGLGPTPPVVVRYPVEAVPFREVRGCSGGGGSGGKGGAYY